MNWSINPAIAVLVLIATTVCNDGGVMGKPSVKELANSFIGAAERDPENRPKIFRKAAQVFAGLASDPQNQHMAKRLTAIGLDFAGAAQAAFQAATTSDFTQILKDTAQAYEELDPNTPFTHQAMDMIAKYGANASVNSAGMPISPNGTPGVTIAPATFNNKDVTLGRSVQVRYAPSAEDTMQGIFQSQTVAFWQGTKQESQAMTIDIGTVLPPLPPPLDPLNLVPASTLFDARSYATIEYGSDGNRQSNVTVDVGLGRRLTVVGNYISVVVGMDPPSPGYGSPILTLGASIGAFAAPSQAPVTRTIYKHLITTLESDLIPIPARAVQILQPLVENYGAAGGDLLIIRFKNYSGYDIVTWEWAYTGLTPFVGPIPIPNDAYFVTVQNKAAGNIRLVFELSL